MGHCSLVLNFPCFPGIFIFEFVRPVRLELTRPKTLEPKSSASANSATGACENIV